MWERLNHFLATFVTLGKMYHLTFDDLDKYNHARAVLESADFHDFEPSWTPHTIKVATVQTVCTVVHLLLPHGINCYINVVQPADEVLGPYSFGSGAG